MPEYGGPGPEGMGWKPEETNIDSDKKVSKTGFLGRKARAAALGIGSVLGLGAAAEKPAEAQTYSSSHYSLERAKKEAPKKEKLESASDKAKDIQNWLKAIGLDRAKITVVPPRGRELAEKHAFAVDFNDKGNHSVLFVFDGTENLVKERFFENFQKMLNSPAFEDMSADDKKALQARMEKELGKAPVGPTKAEAKEAAKPKEALKKSMEMANHELGKLKMQKRFEVAEWEMQTPDHQQIVIRVKGGKGVVLESYGHVFTQRELERKVQSAVLELQDPNWGKQ